MLIVHTLQHGEWLVSQAGLDSAGAAAAAAELGVEPRLLFAFPTARQLAQHLVQAATLPLRGPGARLAEPICLTTVHAASCKVYMRLEKMSMCLTSLLSVLERFMWLQVKHRCLNCTCLRQSRHVQLWTRMPHALGGPVCLPAVKHQPD